MGTACTFAIWHHEPVASFPLLEMVRVRDAETTSPTPEIVKPTLTQIMTKLNSLKVPFRHNGQNGNTSPVSARNRADDSHNHTQNFGLTVAQAKSNYVATGQLRNGRPLFLLPTTQVLSLKSGFAEKLLCDGPTFTLGLACGFTCSFCYADSQLNRHPGTLRILKETGLTFDQIAIEKDSPLPVLEKELLLKNDTPRYADPKDHRVIYSWSLVDVAANLKTAELTIQECLLILKFTRWQIRLLSKSALLKQKTAALAAYKQEVIYGLSTGTFDDKLAASFEKGTSSPTARIRTLHWLQDNGYRTFGMICPSLPQEDYEAFAERASQAIRADRCEQAWAEVLNVRGKSLKTCASLREGGFEKEAALERVREDRIFGEHYARERFLAHAKTLPPGKLRFLQYVEQGQNYWWITHEAKGGRFCSELTQNNRLEIDKETFPETTSSQKASPSA
jgi:DNA repair photolyase